MIHVGIDTGTNTGVAVWDGDAKRFLLIETMPIHAALLYVLEMHQEGRKQTVYFEDARLRTWYGTRTAKEDRDKLQGAGSIKRDCAIWEDALTAWGIPFRKVAPKENATKRTADWFRRITGWTGRTNEHGRDAAMLVYGR